MIRKISFFILSVAILVFGVIAFSKLSYWDRSVRIFSFSSVAPFAGRMDHDRGARREFAHSETQNLPDSLRLKFESQDRARKETGPSNEGRRDREGRGRGEFPGGKKLNLRNVVWFLAVFASFTVITIYLDKAYCVIREK